MFKIYSFLISYKYCVLFITDGDDDLLSFEKLDRSSPDLWPEQSACIMFLFVIIFAYHESNTFRLEGVNEMSTTRALLKENEKR